MPGDDLVDPIIGFVPLGVYDPSPTKPLGALVSRDVPGRIAAGHAGAIPGDYVTSMVWVYKPEIGRRQHHNLRAVKLAKDAASMEPTIRRGSIVIIDPAETAIHKKAIYAVRLEQYEGECAIKRVRENDNLWIFVSDNPDYDPIIMKKEQNQNPIIGKVIWSWTSWVK